MRHAHPPLRPPTKSGEAAVRGELLAAMTGEIRVALDTNSDGRELEHTFYLQDGIA